MKKIVTLEIDRVDLIQFLRAKGHKVKDDIVFKVDTGEPYAAEVDDHHPIVATYIEEDDQ